MTIIGVGTDIVSIDRIAKAINGINGNAFINRILTESEKILHNQINNGHKKTSFVAKRFAAKEAISKALGVGIGKHFGFHDASILNDNLGKPIVILNDNVKIMLLAKLVNAERNEGQYDVNTHISLSDEKSMSIAFVIITLINTKD